jgi:hypothetical protein
MWLRLGVIAYLFALVASFPADTAQTLEERYGPPISETYLVRPEIVASARYGRSGHVCEIVLSPRKPPSLIKSGHYTIDSKQLSDVLDEIVPIDERGKYLIGTFDDITCLPDNDCGGVQGKWENVVIYRNGSTGNEHYATIQWRREECRQLWNQTDPLLPPLALTGIYGTRGFC